MSKGKKYQKFLKRLHDFERYIEGLGIQELISFFSNKKKDRRNRLAVVYEIVKRDETNITLLLSLLEIEGARVVGNWNVRDALGDGIKKRLGNPTMNDLLNLRDKLLRYPLGSKYSDIRMYIVEELLKRKLSNDVFFSLYVDETDCRIRAILNQVVGTKKRPEVLRRWEELRPEFAL